MSSIGLVLGFLFFIFFGDVGSICVGCGFFLVVMNCEHFGFLVYVGSV